MRSSPAVQRMEADRRRERASLHTHRLCSAGLFLGLAVMTKGPVGVLIPGHDRCSGDYWMPWPASGTILRPWRRMIVMLFATVTLLTIGTLVRGGPGAQRT
jgi:hypothetical protein